MGAYIDNVKIQVRTRSYSEGRYREFLSAAVVPPSPSPLKSVTLMMRHVRHSPALILRCPKVSVLPNQCAGSLYGSEEAWDQENGLVQVWRVGSRSLGSRRPRVHSFGIGVCSSSFSFFIGAWK
ncbi:hypothetical protein B0H12DRAFT_1131886 [Mycena haematopus]|nr:hypothetical protein B0H12DRAFT_1131886 [Mycena haematopus]